MTCPSDDRPRPVRRCAECGRAISNHDKWRFERRGAVDTPVHRVCEWPASRGLPHQYEAAHGQATYGRMRRLLYGLHNWSPCPMQGRNDLLRRSEA